MSMELVLKRAGLADAEFIWNMQKEAFAELLKRYQDYETNPASEPIDKQEEGKRKRISPLFILPQYWNRGLAQQAILAVEEIHGSTGWELDTILQEKGNCHLYEKMGYRVTGKQEQINKKMTLVFYEK